MNTQNLFSLDGKTALVTGSARGIGHAIAAALKAAGAQVLLHGATESDHLKAAAKELDCSYAAADLSDAAAVAPFADAVLQKLGKIDILVLNSSVQSYTGLANFTQDEFLRMMQTNVASCFSLIAKFAPAMAERKFGRIISISSMNQIRPAERLGVYSMTKAALGNMTLMAAKNYAASGVTANTILPGVIETDRNREALKNQAFADGLRAAIPAHRFGTPEDCAGVAVFLASDAASYITGAEIPVAGGWQL